jgi:thioredoxin-like negative regulator of GroEL
MNPKRFHPIVCLVAALTAAVVALTAIGLSAAEPAAPKRDLSATDIDGNPVRVPLADKPCLLVFLMADQPQSLKEAEVINAAVGAHPGVQVVTLVSGPQAEAAAKSLKGKLPGEIVVDKDYALAGKMSVRAWPTTLVIQPDGQELAHLAGLAKSFAKDLDSYLDFATGKIDRETLNRRISASQVIEDDPHQMARRHLEVAERQLAKGFLAAARQELERGLRQDPKNADLALANANLTLLQGDAAQAVALLDKIDPASVPPWKIDTVKGRALVALKQWDAAAAVLEKAVRLNPEPGEAWYALGQMHEAKGQWQQAAQAYRAAFESTSPGRTLKAAEPATPPKP